MHTFIFLFEEPKVIFKSRKRGGHGEMKSDKRTNNDQQNITEKTEDLATRTSLETGFELRCSGSVGSSCST